MANRPLCFFLIVFHGVVCSGQNAALSSGSLTVVEGTTLRLDGPVALTIASGAQLVNNGVIDLGENATLVEQEGDPITGAGTEVARSQGTGPFNALEPGGLGLIITSSGAIGPVEVVRGHVPFMLPAGVPSIARWYRINSGTDEGGTLQLLMTYDESELNGLLEGSMNVFGSGSELGPWSALATTSDPGANTLSAIHQYPWALITAFDENASILSPTLSAEHAFHVWPTVLDGAVNIVSRKNEVVHSIELFDGLGRSVPVVLLYRSGSTVIVDTRSLSSGLHVIRVNGSSTFDLIKP